MTWSMWWCCMRRVVDAETDPEATDDYSRMRMRDG